MAASPPLPVDWVRFVMDALTVRYGRDFLQQFEAVKEDALHEDWATQLSGFGVAVGDEIQFPAITWAVENLPEKMPRTVTEFRALARSYRPKGQAALPAPTGRVAIPDNIRDEMRRIAAESKADPRPERVKVAERYVALRRGKTNLNPQEQADLDHFRKILEWWAMDQARAEDTTTGAQA